MDGPRAGNVLQRLVRSRFTRWFPVRSATPMRTPKNPPHQLAARHRYKPPTYPAYSKLSANSPTTWARCRLPERNQTWRPNWTTKLPALATTRNQKLPPNLMPRPMHPTTTKMTGALAFNSVLHEHVRISPVRITPIPAAPSDSRNCFKIKI